MSVADSALICWVFRESVFLEREKWSGCVSKVVGRCMFLCWLGIGVCDVFWGYGGFGLVSWIGEDWKEGGVFV